MCNRQPFWHKYTQEDRANAKGCRYCCNNKGDIVSQAEREVFASKVNSVNPKAMTMHINGLTGQGAFELSTLLYDEDRRLETVTGMELRYPMPSALCSRSEERRVGKEAR